MAGRLNRAWPGVLAAGSIAATAAYVWPYTVDDAFVLARYARRIVRGAGYTMNDGPPTDGVTGPLGLSGGVLGEWAIRDPVFGAKALGLLCTLLAVLLAAWVEDRDARPSGLERAVRGLLLAMSPLVAVWSIGGLETGIATFAFTLGVIGVDAKWKDAHAAGTVGVAIAALAWLRPETALPAAAMLGALAVRRGRRAALIASALALSGGISIVVFRLVMFDTVLPLSVIAKPADLVNGARYVAGSIALGLGAMTLPLAVAARRGSPAAIIVLVHLLALLLAGGDWMPGYRLLVVALPVAARAAAAPLAGWLASPGRTRGFGALAMMSMMIAPVYTCVVVLPSAREAGITRETVGARLADAVAAHASSVAMVDVGYVPYRAEVEVIDLGGITDPRIGLLRGGHVAKEIDAAWLEARAPAWIILHSTTPPRADVARHLRWLSGHPVEQRVAQMRWVIGGYRVREILRYSEGYFYVVLERRDPATEVTR